MNRFIAVLAVLVVSLVLLVSGEAETTPAELMRPNA